MFILSKEQFETLNATRRNYGYSSEDLGCDRGLQSVSKVAARIQKLGYQVRVVHSQSVLDVELKVDLGVLIEDRVYCFQVKSSIVGAQNYINKVQTASFKVKVSNRKVKQILGVSYIPAPDCLVPSVSEVLLIPATPDVKPRFFGKRKQVQSETVSYSNSNPLLSKTGKRLYGAALQSRIGKLVRTTSVAL